jgi:hypothetical protein
MTTMREFISKNKEMIKDIILAKSPNNRLDYDELELWVENDEGLYLWAKREGVKI